MLHLEEVSVYHVHAPSTPAYECEHDSATQRLLVVFVTVLLPGDWCLQYLQEVSLEEVSSSRCMLPMVQLHPCGVCVTGAVPMQTPLSVRMSATEHISALRSVFVSRERVCILSMESVHL